MSRTVPQTSRAAKNGAGWDKCWTPPQAWWILRPYIPAGTRIWECAAGDGWLARWMREDGYHVFESEYDRGQDFEFYEPDEPYDMIITNTPFSKIKMFLERAEALGKPFAFIAPYSTQYGAKVKKIRDSHGSKWWELRPNRRINYYMPGTGYHNNGAQMSTVWLTKGILTQDTDVDLPDPPPEHRLIKPPKRQKPTRDDIIAWVAQQMPASPEAVADLIIEAMKGKVPIVAPNHQVDIYEYIAAQG